MEKLQIAPMNATRMCGWLETRGGIAQWRSVNLSNPSGSWSTPALTEKGEPYPKPTWQAESTPSRIITDIEECEVVVPREVKRFRIAIRRGDGLSFKLTNHSSERVQREAEKAGEKAWYVFDYETQEAVILVPDRTVPLSEWKERTNDRDHDRSIDI